MTDTLELAGHRVVAAPDGETALSILGRETVDLVLSDVQMLGIDGYELLRRSKIVKPGIPFVLMTAYGQIERAVAAMRGGAADYLAKPFEMTCIMPRPAMARRRMAVSRSLRNSSSWRPASKG